jgi:hypothetical protein
VNAKPVKALGAREAVWYHHRWKPGVGKLDEALPMERGRRDKSGLEGSACDGPGLKQDRGRGKETIPRAWWRR